MAKLDSKRFGPFQVTAMVGHTAYHLDIPLLWKKKGKHDVLHKAHLSPHQGPVFENLIVKPEVINGEEVFKVKHILDSKKIGCSIHYLIKWHHYNHANNTWEPATNLNTRELVKEFYNHYSMKPHPSCL